MIVNGTLLYYFNDLPRYGLGIVFLWFGIDKFTLHDFYISWFSATQRVTDVIPFEDPSFSIHLIGIVEIILAILIITGIRIRLVCFFVVAFLILTMATARYPSSFPQDIGMLGISIMLILVNGSTIRSQIPAQRFLRYGLILQLSLSVVLLLWAGDHITNTEKHIGWLELARPWLTTYMEGNFQSLITGTAAVEIILGATLFLPHDNIKISSLIATTIFLGTALFILAPPLNNHQTVALTLSTAWLSITMFYRK